MTIARDDILARVRAQARDADHPAAWQSQRHFDDLADRFAASLTKVHGEVIRAGSLESALDRLSEIAQAISARRIVVNDEPPFSGASLGECCPDVRWFIVGRSAGDLRAFCETADIGLSSAEAALAETGSIVVSSGPGRSRLATLLPPVHIALVPVDRLTTNLFTWAAARQEPPPAMLTVISGPSKTADIEQTMAIGVHGPKRFIVVLYEG